MLTSDYVASFDGTMIHYQVNRRIKNPTLVFIHGVGSNHTAWAKITPFLKDRSYIAVDLRNHGLSGFGRFSVEAVTRDIAEILMRERIREFIPVGMSIGAPIAMELTKRFPSKARRLILVSPSSRSFVRGSVFITESMRVIRAVLQLFPRRKHLKLVKHEKRIPALLNPIWELQGIHLRDFTRALECALETELDFFSVRKPTLVLLGKNDVLLNKPRIRREIERHRHVHIREIPAHHLILTRAPLQAAQHITAFAGD